MIKYIITNYTVHMYNGATLDKECELVIRLYIKHTKTIQCWERIHQMQMIRERALRFMINYSISDNDALCWNVYKF